MRWPTSNWVLTSKNLREYWNFPSANVIMLPFVTKHNLGLNAIWRIDVVWPCVVWRMDVWPNVAWRTDVENERRVVKNDTVKNNLVLHTEASELAISFSIPLFNHSGSLLRENGHTQTQPTHVLWKKQMAWPRKSKWVLFEITNNLQFPLTAGCNPDGSGLLDRLKVFWNFMSHKQPFLSLHWIDEWQCYHKNPNTHLDLNSGLCHFDACVADQMTLDPKIMAQNN